MPHSRCRRLHAHTESVSKRRETAIDSPSQSTACCSETIYEIASSQVPSDDTYVGPRAFSEPETRTVRNLVARELFRGVITYHSYSQLILYPWGYTEQPIPDATDRATMIELAERMQQLIKGVHGSTYRPL